MGFFDALANLFNRGGSVFPEISIGEDFYGNAVVVSSDIDKLSRSLRDFSVPMTLSVHRVIIPAIKENFEREGRPVKWKALSSITVAQRNGRAHPILRRTDNLYNAATSSSIWTITKTEAFIPSLPVNYGDYHITGTRKMPKRDFMYLSDTDKTRIAAIFSDWLDKQITTKGRFK